MVDGSLKLMPIRGLFQVRSRLGKGFMFDSQKRFAGPDAALSAQPIDESSVGDRNQPWPKRPSRIVGLPDGMDGQQNILDCVLHVAWIAVPPRRERKQVGHDVLQETMVGGSVAILGAGHEYAPINVPDDRLRLICAAGAIAPVCPDELQ